MDLIDAYTVKKVLPRLLAAAILINLSIYIVALLVDLDSMALKAMVVLKQTIIGALLKNKRRLLHTTEVESRSGAIGGGC